VPTFIESGVSDFVAASWVGILAPAKTPPIILQRLNDELNAVLNDPELRQRLQGLSIATVPGTSAQFREAIQRDLARYGEVVKAAGIRVDKLRLL
jgi:tripartite-type tricarboxylate transporter receptor subunit TctC